MSDPRPMLAAIFSASRHDNIDPADAEGVERDRREEELESIEAQRFIEEHGSDPSFLAAVEQAYRLGQMSGRASRRDGRMCLSFEQYGEDVGFVYALSHAYFAGYQRTYHGLAG